MELSDQLFSYLLASTEDTILNTLEKMVLTWAQYQNSCNPLNVRGKQLAECKIMCWLLAIEILYGLEETYDLS